MAAASQGTHRRSAWRAVGLALITTCAVAGAYLGASSHGRQLVVDERLRGDIATARGEACRLELERERAGLRTLASRSDERQQRLDTAQTELDALRERALAHAASAAANGDSDAHPLRRLLFGVEALRHGPDVHAAHAVQVLLPRLPPVEARLPHTADVTFADFRADGSRFATLQRRGLVQVFDAETSRRVSLFRPPGSALALRFAPEGGTLATAGGDGVVRLWDADEGRELTTLRSSAETTRMSEAQLEFAPDGRRIAASWDRPPTMCTWDVAGGAATCRPLSEPVVAFAWRPDGEALALAEETGRVAVWSPTPDAVIGETDLGKEPKDVAWRPDGGAMAVVGKNGAAMVWSGEHGAEPHRFGDGDYWTTYERVAFDSAGKRMATADSGDAARIWDADGRAEQAVLKHPTDVARVRFLPGEDARLLTVSDDGSVRIWDIEERRELALMVNDAPVNHVAVAPDGARLVAACDEHDRPERAVHVWDTDRGEAVFELWGDDAVFGIALPRDAAAIALSMGGMKGGGVASVRVYDVRSGTESARQVTSLPVFDLCLAPSGEFLAGAEGGGLGSPSVVHVWTFPHLQPVTDIPVATGVSGLAFRRGDELVGTTDANEVVAWNARTGEWLKQAELPGRFSTPGFSAGGRFVALASGEGGAGIVAVDGDGLQSWAAPVQTIRSPLVAPDGRALAWVPSDVTGEPTVVRTWRDDRSTAEVPCGGEVEALAMSPDGALLVASANAAAPPHGRLVLHPMAGGSEPRVLRIDAPVGAVAFSPDGARLAVARADGTLALRHMPEGDVEARLAQPSSAERLTFDPSGRYIAAASEVGAAALATVWDISRPGDDPVYGYLGDAPVVFLPDGRHVASECQKSTMCLLDRRSRRITAQYGGEGNPVAAAVDRDGARVAYVTYDGDLVSWTPEDGAARIHSISARDTTAMTFDADGRRVLLLARDTSVRSADVSSGATESTVPAAEQESQAVLAPGGRWYVRVSDGPLFSTEPRAIEARDPWTGDEIWQGRPVVHGKVAALTPGGDGDLVALHDQESGASDSKRASLLVLDGRTGAVVRRIPFPLFATVEDMALRSSAGVLVACGDVGIEDVGYLWIASLSDAGFTAIQLPDTPSSVALDPSGRRVVVCGGSYPHSERWCEVRDVASGAVVARRETEYGVEDVEFAPDGRELALLCGFSAFRWRWRPEDMVDEACRRARRDVSHREWRSAFGDAPWRRTCALDGDVDGVPDTAPAH